MRYSPSTASPLHHSGSGLGPADRPGGGKSSAPQERDDHQAREGRGDQEDDVCRQDGLAVFLVLLFHSPSMTGRGGRGQAVAAGAAGRRSPSLEGLSAVAAPSRIRAATQRGFASGVSGAGLAPRELLLGPTRRAAYSAPAGPPSRARLRCVRGSDRPEPAGGPNRPHSPVEIRILINTLDLRRGGRVLTYTLKSPRLPPPARRTTCARNGPPASLPLPGVPR